MPWRKASRAATVPKSRLGSRQDRKECMEAARSSNALLKIYMSRHKQLDKTQSIEIVKHKSVKAQELSLISENEHSLQSKEKRIPKMVVKAQELSLISENDHSLQSKQKRIPKMVKMKTIKETTELNKSTRFWNSPFDLEKTNQALIATIEQPEILPSGSRNRSEVTFK
ncbi:hypothetical protein Avbf_19191 [Armadillidium vulgare]|nr:hypothetical protein Avbf_19191 [Armadillidium vulgare]